MTHSEATKVLDLYDIQGHVCKGYGRYGFPKARYCFLNFQHASSAREFLLQLVDKVTTSETWPTSDNDDYHTIKPSATFNIGFTYAGLVALDLPLRSLKGFPVDFTMGMKARSELLGDTGISSPEHWDAIWQSEQVHAWVAINGRDQDAIEFEFNGLESLVKQHPDGVEILSGIKGPNSTILHYQDASAVFENGMPSAKEHFGFTDGISNPYFAGCGNSLKRIPGRGKLMRDGSWQALATGEFILGHIDEAQEYPPAPEPKLLSRNGTFMVYRKLHENVDTFTAYIDNLAKDFNGSRDLLLAKMAGRWPDNGAPLTLAASDDEKACLDARMIDIERRVNEGDELAVTEREALRSQWVDFTYNEDQSGGKCPIGAHARRTNTRGSLETEKGAFHRPGALIDRRRLMRRGLPYGGIDEAVSDEAEQGIIFMSIGASIERQFEFVQQQWVNYSNDFKLGNDKDPIIGSNDGHLADKHIIQADTGDDNNEPPFFCTQMPRFVETRGGDYFFIPSISALRMIAENLIDPS
ncbi:MAG: Dyp-type peroxidase family [Oleispira sp.]|jgi:Dyp-type peroxidase family